MDEQPEFKEPLSLSDIEYTSNLAFLVGFFYAALMGLRNSGQISRLMEENIDKQLEEVRPTLERVYAESFRRPSGEGTREGATPREPVVE
jgi:hypothetical protein